MSSARSEEGLIDGLAYSEDGILPDEISKIRPAFITSMETLRRLLRQDPISREDWMNGYRQIHAVISSRSATDLLPHIYSFIEAGLLAFVRFRMDHLCVKDGAALVTGFAECWERYQKCTTSLDSFLHPVNHTVGLAYAVRPHREELPGLSTWRQAVEIEPFCMTLWRSSLNEELMRRLIPAMVDLLLDIDYLPESIEILSIHKIFKSFVAGMNVVEPISRIGIRMAVPGQQQSMTDSPYMDSFETRYFDCATMRMERTRRALVANGVNAQFCRTALQIMQTEDARCQLILPPSMQLKFRRAMLQTYVGRCEEKLLDAVPVILADRDMEFMTCLYQVSMFGYEVGDKKLFFWEKFKSFIVSEASAAVSDLADKGSGVAFIEKVISQFDYFGTMIESCFSGDEQMENARQSAFQAVMHTYKRSPEYLAKYLDVQLRKYATSDNLEALLSRFKEMLALITDKDIFQKYYMRLLARRLLSSSAADIEHEQRAISKMKGEHSFSFTAPFLRMCLDFSVSTDLTKTFASATRLTEKQEGDRSPTHPSPTPNFFILRSGIWLLSSTPFEVDLPPSLLRLTAKFTEFYSSQHKGRVLKWTPQHSSAEVRLTYLDKQYLMTISIFQYLILQLFEREDHLPIQVILDRIKLPRDVLLHELKSLKTHKLLILDQKDSDDKMVVSLNLQATYKRVKNNLKFLAASNVPVAERTKIQADIHFDRGLLIQASIVRIMKAKNMLTHQQLIQEVISDSMAHFKATIPMIKRGIEALLEKDYIERNKDRPDVYVYVA